MNRWEIEEAKWLYASHPVLGKATTLLYDLMTATNAVSDGWHSWPGPCRAAKRLQQLIQRGAQVQQGCDRGPDVTDADLRRAMVPIKALLTREAQTFAGQTIPFP